jgi:hypothetical protein
MYVIKCNPARYTKQKLLSGCAKTNSPSGLLIHHITILALVPSSTVRKSHGPPLEPIMLNAEVQAKRQ